MKKINLKGIHYIEPVYNCNQWYWGTDYIHGDLYEAEELYKNNSWIESNRLVFVKYPEGEVLEPIKASSGQYFGRPAYYEGQIHFILVDFKEGFIYIYKYDETNKDVIEVANIALSKVEDCYNIFLQIHPLMLTRSNHDGIFQIIYPEIVDIAIGDREYFFERDGDKLYFERWDKMSP